MNPTTEPKKPRVPDLFVERAHVGESSDAERARVLADPDAKERLDGLPRENAVFLVRHPPEEMLPQLEARARRAAAMAEPPARRTWWPVLLVAVPLAALALVVARMPGATDPGAGPGLEHTTAKGLKAKLRVTQSTPRGPERVMDEEVLFEGDEIQVSTVAGDARHGVVVSIDGRGTVTRHFPAEGADTTLPPGQRPLGRAFRLDDAPAFERFVFVTDDAPIDVDAVVAAARQAAAGADPRRDALPLPEGLDQSSFVVRKGEK